MKAPSSADDGSFRPAERLAVMISSTSLDLPYHREAVNEAIRRVGYYPLAMEHGSAEADSNALTFSLGLVDQADVFVGLLAFRYGYVPADPVSNPNGWSITEFEYRRALERGIPVLIYLMHDEHPITRKDFELSEAAQRKLEAMKGEVITRHVCGFFRSVDELQALVIQSLSEIERKRLLRREAGRARPAGPFQSPPLPAHYVRRPEEEQRLERNLLQQDAGPGGLAAGDVRGLLRPPCRRGCATERHHSCVRPHPLLIGDNATGLWRRDRYRPKGSRCLPAPPGIPTAMSA
jgi:hypothetical protein